jgi:6-phosphofructo-2-kinase
MRLKLRGPDYKDKDPESSYEDFKKRVAAYASAYIPLGDYEEQKHMQYIKMIDVGRKIIHYQVFSPLCKCSTPLLTSRSSRVS